MDVARAQKIVVTDEWMARAVIFVAAATPLYLVRFTVFGLPTTVLEILIIALCVATVMHAMVFSHVRQQYAAQLRAVPREILIGSVIFFLASVIAVFVAPDARAAFGIWRAYVLEAMAFGLVAFLHLDGARQWRALAAAVSVAAAVVATVAIVQEFTGWGIPNPFWRAEATRRVTSFFGYPNAVGLYLELVVPFLVTAAVVARSRVQRVWYVGVIMASVLAIVWAGSSGTIAALTIVVGIGLFVWKKTRLATGVIALVAVLAVAVTPLRRPFADEFLLQGISGNLRINMWKETVEMLRDRPFFGAGVAGYQVTVKPYHRLQWAEIYLYPHNLALTLWSEFGLLGLLAFVWVCATLLWRAVRGLRGAVTTDDRVVAVIVCATLIIIAIHGLVDTPYFKNDFSALFWLIVALGVQVRYTRNS